jgi:hypothetical protein
MSQESSPEFHNETFEAQSPPGSSSTKLFVEIPKWEDHTRDDGSKYTIYEIVVRCKGRKWILHKRYSDFVALRESVKGLDQCINKFDFPHKSKFNTFSKWTKERRRTGFEDFMMLLLGSAARPREVDQFLAVETNLKQNQNELIIGAQGESHAASTKHASLNFRSPKSDISSSISPVPKSGHSSHFQKSRSTTLSESMNSISSTKCIPKFPPLTDPTPPLLLPQNGSAISKKNKDGITPRKQMSRTNNFERSFSKRVVLGLLVSACIFLVVLSVWWISGIVGILSLTIALTAGVIMDRHEGIVKILSSSNRS